MNIKFIELEVDWPSEISVFELREFLLSKLRKNGEPLRWAITSLNQYSTENIQKIMIEAVLIVNKEEKNNAYVDLI